MPDSAFACVGLGPFGYPSFPLPCPNQAEFYVWPKTDPQYTTYMNYGYLCAEHLAQLRAISEVAQITEIATNRVVFPGPAGAR